MVTGSRLDKVAEKSFLFFCMHRFGMPLDTQGKGVSFHLQCLGDAVRSLCSDLEAPSRCQDCLVVKTVDSCIFPENLI